MNKDRGFIFFVVALFLLSFFLVLKDSYASVFSNGSHCVAYIAKKRMFLIRTVEVIGKNCEVVSQVVPDIGGYFSYKLEIPIENFESGEAERDKDVRKLLKAKKQSSIYFVTDKMTREEWQAIINSEQSVKVKGQLNIAGSNYPVSASVKLIKSDSGIEAEGIIKTQFKDLGLKPPELFGGVMAKVKEELVLEFHLQSDKTLGFDSLTKSESLAFE
ncbi:MAG: YceI family protein [Bdellovibrionales bacterium]|nr:YceI family protein [Bdellovibrionales bacterium]